MEARDSHGHEAPWSPIIPFLRCVQCRSSSLVLGEGQTDTTPALADQLGRDVLYCGQCGTTYPVTRDGIPIMWTDRLRACLEASDKSASTLAANIAVYERTSSQYAAFRRQTLENARRMRHAAAHLTRRTPRSATSDTAACWHLDFGCGPGHVLKWLCDLGLRQVGLDVSLTNLRNARQTTNALVVLGSADNMPFCDGVFDLVTESSVLHHIEDWRATINEACRVCCDKGGIVLDSEPSTDSLDWSAAARMVFEHRWYVYKLLSYFAASKYDFRDLKHAKLNYYMAELHNQPGKGFPVDEIRLLLQSSGFETRLVCAPDENWNSVARPSWQGIVLRFLSGQNPWNPKYGPFGVLASRAPSCRAA
ncbi:MAG: methyltransferase domain-containing protein [Pirellulales bacterium]|nr:methyltransferase domain-containing protein [Pirellulales bacterium]